MAAINNDMRGRIVTAVLKHGFRQRLTDFMAIEAPLAHRLYERIYPEDTRAAVALLTERHEGSTYWRRSLPVNVGGAKIIVGRSDNSVGEQMGHLIPSECEKPGFRVPYCDRSATTALINFEAEDALGKQVMEYGLLREAINDEIKVKRAEVASMSRKSCIICIMSSKDDLTRAAELQPQVYARYCHKEVELGFTVSMSGKRLPEITGIEPLPLAA